MKPASRHRVLKIIFRVGVGLLVALCAVVAGFIALNREADRTVAELQARWAPPPSQFIDVAGMKVHLRDEGPRDDPLPIVLLHGTSASLHTWDGWAAGLSSQRRVIRMDLPGFGLTGPFADSGDGAGANADADDYTVAHYVYFIDALLTKLGVAHCVLAGNSFGGQIAIATALAHPERVEKLILIDSSGYPLAPASIPIGFRLARIPLLNKAMEVTLPRGVVEDSVRNVYGDPARVTPEIVDRYFELALRAGNRRALVERLKQVPVDAITEQIPKVKIPTLILWGRRDRLIPPEAAGRFQRDIAGSQLVLFDDLGHVPQEEDAPRTLAAAKEFLGIR